MTNTGGDQGGQNPGWQDPNKQAPGFQESGYSRPEYPSQGYQGPAYPTQGYPGQQYAYPPAAPIAGTNGLAIASLIVSLVSCGPVGLILGIISLSQIKKSGQQGRGMAIAGIVIGAVTALLWIVAVIVIIVAAAEVANDPYYYEYNY